MRFWLDKGVDGVRLDAINFCFHDRQLRDNLPKPVEQRVGRGFSPAKPYAFRYHYYNNTQLENLAFLGQLRARMDGYPDVAALGEISRRIRWRRWPSTPPAVARTWAAASSC